MTTNSDQLSKQYGSSAYYLDYVLEKQLLEIAPKRIVDFGAGAGKNGKIAKKMLGDSVHTVAVEGFQPTAEMLRSSGVYTEVCHDLIQNWLKNNPERYDLAIFGDVLEHLSVPEIRWVMRKCLRQFNNVIVIVPLCDIFQDEKYGNKLEIHKSYITESFFNRYNPEEKHIKVDRWYYTIMNVKINSDIQKELTLKQFGKRVLHFIIPVVQPLGLARPLVVLIRFIGKKFGVK